MLKDPHMANLMDPVLAFPIRLPPADSRTLLRGLHEQLRGAILDGRLQPGLRLPATRALATACGVSRNTAVAAYDLLLSEGYLVTRPRSGAYVADVLPQLRNRKASSGDAAVDRRLNAFWREPPLMMPAPMRSTPRFDFRPGVAEKRLFPFEIWRRLSARALRAFAGQASVYAGPKGRQALRDAVAKHVSFARAVACRPTDIIVTAGSQQAFDLLARILVTSGRTVVAIENPGYLSLHATIAAVGAKVVPVPVDDEGMIVEKLPADARVICVTPSHQYPLGTAMSMQRRAALLEFVHARNAVVIEDDYDGEFRYGGRPLDALQTLDRSESVFYVGTFSKSLFPGIRLGFVVAPPWAQRALVAVKQCADWHCPVLEQDTLAAFISEGHMARHVRKMRQVYGARLKLLLSNLRNDFSRWLEPIPSVAGLHMAAFARSSADMEAIAEQARELDVGVYPLRQYYFSGRARQGLIFGYGAIEEREIVEGLSRLRRLWPK
jgi:GntR family transcriptional regulator / MocR family aminotransferase